ncbi:MAG TPA: ketopantoate reductase family protein [Acidocella sp.]|uniref:ketopantoate reductase family protein n=1 Tax=Acidocella sp. TaxID=50710 RepID=UPI002C041E82|nr:ketopantoate reductase family protein [Acidocella sp.]HVE21023.1 ketopantoate reductase family protein [Acidocella sp.]
MKISVMGAGAVGSYYGAMLAQAKHDVTFIGRPAQVAALREHGLLVEKGGSVTRLAVQASSEPSAVSSSDVVVFSVKSSDTEAAAKAIAPFLRPDALVLSFQNGVENTERLQLLLPQTVIATVVYVGTDMAAPNHVRYRGGGNLVIAASARSPEIADLFNEAGISTEISENAAGALWAKFILNCAYNALSAITQMPYSTLAQGPEIDGVLHDAVQECLSIATALGVSVPGDTWGMVAQVPVTMAAQRSSTAQDLARQKPSEIDYLNGYIVRKGRELNIPVPVNRTLYALVKLLETKKEG